MSQPKFDPATVYVTYVGAAPEAVWHALVESNLTRQYFFGLAIEIEPRTGGAFKLTLPDGKPHIVGKVVDWSPPRRLTTTWQVVGMQHFEDLPECLVTYDLEPMGQAVRLTMTEAHSWDVPKAVLEGGSAGWPMILSGLKSVLETGKPLQIEGGGPSPEFIAAVQKAAAEKPWLGGRQPT